MNAREMIVQLRRQLHEKAESLLSNGQYGDAAEAVSALEALATAQRLLAEASGSPVDHSMTESSSDPSEVGPVSGSESEYPYFLKVDGDLVKVGWSSKNEQEYVHRAPRSSVESVCRAVERAASGHSSFGRDDLTGLAASERGGIPDYQVYLCLSWLRWAGLLNRVQRGKYAVPNLRQFKPLWSRAWDQLPLEHL